MSAKRFILVHGASHGSWCWSRVVPLLEAAGASVLAVDLPGRAGRGKAGWRLTLEDYVADLAAIVAREPQPVTLVGHSLAGMSLCGVAERIPDKLERLIFVSAWLPMQGRNLVEMAKDNVPSRLSEAVRVSWLSGTIAVDPARYAEVFCADCTVDDAAWAARQLEPESVRTSFGRVRLTAERFGAVASTYICCEQDQAVSATLQRRMAAAVGCTDVRALPTSHSPFLSAPLHLSELLREIVPGSGA